MSTSPKKQEKGARLNALQLNNNTSNSSDVNSANGNSSATNNINNNNNNKTLSPVDSGLHRRRSTSPSVLASSNSASAAAVATAAAQQNQQIQQQLQQGSIFSPKSIIVGIFKFIFICLVVSFSVWASKFVFCSTTFVSRPDHWLKPSGTLNKLVALTPQQAHLATIESYGERLQYCLLNF